MPKVKNYATLYRSSNTTYTTKFERVDEGPEDATTPGWLLGEEGRRHILGREAGDMGLKPDMIIIEGWPSNVMAPAKPTREWRGKNGHTRKVVVTHRGIY